ncbi:MAG: VWA domain-containing protein [Nanohaloarchaea archaeon]|nr:VWA domain-containing protein [Candidatus Nanohaloarchaea archaeon]
MGRQLTTDFNWDITVTYQPIDTALVIDTSGSMGGGALSSAQSGAKNYVDNTNTGKGDQNAVVSFSSGASTVQSLTSSKSKAKSAINGLSSGGGTDHSSAVSEGHSALNGGSNPNQVMIVLGDGCGGSATTQANNAREDGIEIHAIMYGSGACTGEFESMLTGESCSTYSSENDDSDRCWYARSGTVDKVYNSIREAVSTDRSAELHIIMPENSKSFTYAPDNILSSGQKEYVFDRNVKEGSNSFEMPWSYTSKGQNRVLKTGNSYFRLTEDGDTTIYDFSSEDRREINYVDFDIVDTSVEYNKNLQGRIRVSVTVENRGNEASKQRIFRLVDSSGNKIERDLSPLNPSETKTYNFDFSTSNAVFSDNEAVFAHVDPRGEWDSTSYGEGKTLEPNEGNNRVELGYPPRLVSNFNPVELNHPDWNREFETSFNVEHYSSSEVDGTFKLKEGTEIEADGQPLSEQSLTGNRRKFLTGNLVPDEAERWYNFTFTLTGPNGARSVYEKNYYVENPPPVISDPDPEDDGYAFRYPVELSAMVEDRNNDSVDIRFYNDNNGYLIDEKLSMGDGTRIGADWNVRELGQLRWRMEVYDGVDTTTRTYNFQKVIGSSFRVRPTIEYEYGSLVTSHKNTKVVPLTVTNLVDYSEPRKLAVNLSGVNSRFQSNGKEDIGFELGPGESERFLIEVVPNPPSGKTEKRNLVVTTRNRNFNTETVRKLPVLVRESSSVSPSKEVPGIGSIQIIFIFIMALMIQAGLYGSYGRTFERASSI